MDLERDEHTQKQVGVGTVTDESNTKRDGNDLVLDWDDAVDSWGQDLDGSAVAEAAPFSASAEPKPATPAVQPGPPTPTNVATAPQEFRAKRPPAPPLSLPPLPPASQHTLRPASMPPRDPSQQSSPPHARRATPSSLPPLPSLPPDSRKTSAPPSFPMSRNEKSDLSALARTDSGRPRMYKPPSDHDELKALEAFSNRTLPPPSGGDFPAWLMDDDESDSTKIASIPRELIEALGRSDTLERGFLSGDHADLSGLLAPQTEAGAAESKASPAPESLRLDSDEAFSIRSSLLPTPNESTPISEAPQIEIGLPDDDDDDETYDEDSLDDESFDNELLSGEIEEETTGLHTLPPAPVKVASSKPPPPQALAKARPLPPLGLPKPAFVPPKVPQPLPSNEPSVLRNLDELAPPVEPQPAVVPAPMASEPTAINADSPAHTTSIPAAPQSSAQPQADDAVVVASLRKIRAKRKRVEQLPLAGTDHASKIARIELLSQLASQCVGLESASLLTTAGELAEESGVPALAQSLYERARAQAPELEGPQQGLGRLVFSPITPLDYLKLLERRAQDTTAPQEKARILAVLARLQWLVLRDSSAARSAATEALTLDPKQPGYAQLVARIELSANPAQADAALIRATQEITDPQVKTQLWVCAGRCLEQRGELSKARDCYQQAAAESPASFEAQLALSRSLLATNQHGRAASSMLALSQATQEGSLKEATRRRAATLAFATQQNAEAFAQQELSADPVYLRSLVELSLRQSDSQVMDRAVRRWHETSHGTDRALSLLLLAEIEAAAGHMDAAERALTDALESDPTLSLVPVVRELLSRKYGALLHAVPAGDDALQTAAKLVRSPELLSQELEALLLARNEHYVPECTEAVLLDAALEAVDVERARANLASEAERGTVEERVSALLSLSDYARRHGDQAQARQALQTAYDLDPRNALVARALQRTEIPNEQRVRLLRREAEASTGARAAFLLLRAGRVPNEAPTERLNLLASAYESTPSYVPATWALHQEARKQGDIDRLSDLHAREAGRATDPHEAIAHLVRAALVRAGADADAAAAQLTRALDLMPADPVLRELVIRLGDAVPATLRAEAIQSSAERAPNALRRPATLAAAAAFEDANQPLRALKLFEAVLLDHPGDPIAEMGLERVAKAAGEAAQVVAEARRRLSEGADAATEQKLLETLFRWEESTEQKLALAEQLLKLAPNHAGALRRLEIAAMEANDLEALEHVEKRLIAASTGVRDRVARLRLLSFLSVLRQPETAAPDALDPLFSSLATQATKGLWLARNLMSAAESQGISEDKRALREKATALLLASTVDRTEQSTLSVQRARHLLEVAPDQAVEVLEQYREAASPAHPTLEETLAEAYARTNKREQAADLFEECARASTTKRRTARLYYRAGALHQELGALERARKAFVLAAEADITFGDVETRLEGLLSNHDDLDGLVSLAEARFRSETSADARMECACRLATLYTRQGAHEKAQDTLREALEFSPEHLKGLAQLANLLGVDASQQRERAELLIRIARLSRDPDELCDVFFKLGEIYDEHMPDPKRAEAAYRRVLKLSPRHQPALERLSALQKRSGQTEAAAESLERLIYIAERAEQKRDVSFELSRLREGAGELREAEDVLERLRKISPTDVLVLREMAEFYRRRQAQTALAMHLNRSANDLRQALVGAPGDAALWTALVEMLQEKGRKDAASAAASSAFAAGISSEMLARLVASDGSMLGLESGAFSELLDDLLFPNLLPPAIRILFRHGAEAMGRASPLDLKALAAEKLDRKHPLRAIATEFAKAAGFSEAELYVTAQLPRAFVPASDAPLTILIGKAMLDTTTVSEQRFLMARACKIAKSQMSLTCRLRPDEVSLLLAGLLHAQVPNYRAKGLEPATVEETGRRIQKHLSRKAREEMLPHVVELAAQPELDLSSAYALASSAGNRSALLATGNVSAGISALCKLSGSNETRPDVAKLTAFEEARELLAFSISEPHFEARQRAGAERR